MTTYAGPVAACPDAAPATNAVSASSATAHRAPTPVDTLAVLPRRRRRRNALAVSLRLLCARVQLLCRLAHERLDLLDEREPGPTAANFLHLVVLVARRDEEAGAVCAHRFV